MELWKRWWEMVEQLKPACSRTRTFLWLTVCLAGLCIRGDLCGVTSVVRAMGLKGFCYDRLLDFFHTPAVDVEKLTRRWKQLVLRLSGLVRVNGRLILVGDGLKVPKEGKKMPAVKKLHQESESNTKPAYIFGHSCQVVAVLAGRVKSIFAVPLTSRIHEGVVFSNRDSSTLLDKMLRLIISLEINNPYYFVADAYYAGRTMIAGLLGLGNHLITRVRSNAVAYQPVVNAGQRKRGRPAKYGPKVYLKQLFNDGDLQTATSPVYGDDNVLIRFKAVDLLWRAAGIIVRFVPVIHPKRGRIILMATDLSLSPLEIIRIYGLRFKIEVSFKQALRVLGTYAYHFWMKAVEPIRKNSGDQYLHRKPASYRAAVRRKLSAYHRHIQLGLIAQGIIQSLALSFPRLVWVSWNSWMRTQLFDSCPSEQVTVTALRNTLPEFLAGSLISSIWKKFLLPRIDFDRMEGFRLVT